MDRLSLRKHRRLRRRWQNRVGSGDLSAVEALAGVCLQAQEPLPLADADDNDMVFVYQSPAGDQCGLLTDPIPGSLPAMVA